MMTFLRPPHALSAGELNVVMEKLQQQFHDFALEVFHEARDVHQYEDGSLQPELKKALDAAACDIMGFNSRGTALRKLPETHQELGERLNQIFAKLSYAIETHVPDGNHKEYLQEHLVHLEKNFELTGKQFVQKISSIINAPSQRAAGG